jgi:hypothetical protein
VIWLTEAFMTREGAAAAIPSTSVAAGLVAREQSGVRPRGERENWERERYILARVICGLAAFQPEVFPLEVTRGEAPDFILRGAAGHALSCEVSEASQDDFNVQLSKAAKRAKARVADAAEPPAARLAVRQAFDGLLRRKRRETVWRNAPEATERWLAAYLQAEALVLTEDEIAATMDEAFAAALGEGPLAFHRLVLVRNDAWLSVWSGGEGVTRVAYPAATTNQA